MSFSLLSPVKDDDVDRHIIFLKEAVDRINGNLQSLVFRIAVNTRRDKRKGHCLTAMFLCKRKGGAVTGSQLFLLAMAAAPPARTYGMDYILARQVICPCYLTLTSLATARVMHSFKSSRPAAR